MNVRATSRIVVALVAGAAVATAINVGYQRLHPPPPAPPREPAFLVSGDVVRFPPSAAAALVGFDTTTVELGAPLPRAAMTGRVATLEARTAASFAPLEGRVVSVAVRLGDPVRAGGRLALVRSGELAGMKREERATALAIRTKQALVDRLQLLVASRAATQNDLLVAESERDEARLAAQAAGARLRSLAVVEESDNGYWIVASRAGTVVQLDVAPGKQVGPSRDKPIATVADLDEVLVVADMPQADARGVTAGMPVSIHATGCASEPLRGTVELVASAVDPERQTVPLRIRVKNPGQTLRAHAYVEATLLANDGETQVLLPSDAVVSDGASAVVFVESAHGSYERRAVLVGRRARDRVEIRQGLRPGEHVVVRNALLLLNALQAGAGT